MHEPGTVPVEESFCGRAIRYCPIVARTPDGLDISVQDHGTPGVGQDILFIHGFSQTNLSWLKQVSGPLRETCRLVTYDMRGHGASDKPTVAAYYRDPARWAGEVRAVIEAAGLVRPLLVCWSYAGRVVLDYLTHYGADAIGGLVMVAATSNGAPKMLGPATPLLRAMANAGDTLRNVAATSRLLDVCTASPLPAGERSMMLGFNLLTPPAIRLALTGRPTEYADTLAALQIPLLAIHGARDSINLPAMSRYTCSIAPGAVLRSYENSGHMPFWEESDRFDRDIAAFVGGLGEKKRVRNSSVQEWIDG